MVPEPLVLPLATLVPLPVPPLDEPVTEPVAEPLPTPALLAPLVVLAPLAVVPLVAAPLLTAPLAVPALAPLTEPALTPLTEPALAPAVAPADTDPEPKPDVALAVVPELLTWFVPELVPLAPFVFAPPLTAEPLPLLALVLLARPPHAAMARSTSAVNDRRLWLRNGGAVMARGLSHRIVLVARDYRNRSGPAGTPAQPETRIQARTRWRGCIR
jgi:hypothetical protein